MENLNVMDLNDFLKEAEVLLVDNAKTFNINEWENANSIEIANELGESIIIEGTTQKPSFTKYSLTDNDIDRIISKLKISDISIVDYWKTKQFLKKKNLQKDDLIGVIRNLNKEDYKINSKSEYNEASIFVKNTKIKELGPFNLYIKIDYDSIENTPVIVISIHEDYKHNNRVKVENALTEKEVNKMEDKNLNYIDDEYSFSTSDIYDVDDDFKGYDDLDVPLKEGLILEEDPEIYTTGDALKAMMGNVSEEEIDKTIEVFKSAAIKLGIKDYTKIPFIVEDIMGWYDPENIFSDGKYLSSTRDGRLPRSPNDRSIMYFPKANIVEEGYQGKLYIYFANEDEAHKYFETVRKFQSPVTIDEDMEDSFAENKAKRESKKLPRIDDDFKW